MNLRRRFLLGLSLSAFAVVRLSAQDDPLVVELQYPTKITQMALVGIEDGELVFRPPGRDTGGRAYLSIRELERQRAVVNAWYPAAFAEALRSLETGDAGKALPVLARIARPLLPYLELGPVAGNLAPPVDAWLEALIETRRWEDAAALAGALPLPKVPETLFARVIDLEILLEAEGRSVLADGLRAELLAEAVWPQGHQEHLIRLAGSDRLAERWADAAALYRAVEAQAGPLSTGAGLWAAYCGIEAEAGPPPAGFVETLPDPAEDEPFFALARLVRALALEKAGDAGGAMRAAASGVTASSVDEEWFPPLLMAVARLYVETGDLTAADSAYRQTVFLFPDTAWSGRASAALEQLTPNDDDQT